MQAYSFTDKLMESFEKQDDDKDLLRQFFVFCNNVKKTEQDDDLKGIDYIVELRKGCQIAIDVKRRTKGCRKYWKNGVPEASLEIWSDKEKRTPGWLFDKRKETDVIVFAFDTDDYNKPFFFSYPILRNAVSRNYDSWRKAYGEKKQYNMEDGRTWVGSCVIVPMPVLIAAYIIEICGGSIAFEFALRVSGELKSRAINDNRQTGAA